MIGVASTTSTSSITSLMSIAGILIALTLLVLVYDVRHIPRLGILESPRPFASSKVCLERGRVTT